jgi:HAD superfamily hydrolase (TIGR01490 family)
LSLAFFDLDKTLLEINSGSLWVKRELRLGFLKKRHAARAVVWLAKYKLGFAGGEHMIHEAVAHLKGSASQVLINRTREFYAQDVAGRFRPGALNALKLHRNKGDLIVMLTSSSNYLAQMAASDLQIEHVLCNTLEVDASGNHTGRVVGRACFGSGKLFHAQAFADRVQQNLTESTFYTDSFADISVMEAVRNPVAVHPDIRLRRWAQQHNAPVVNWS